MTQKALIKVDVKRWNVLNAETDIVEALTDKEFNDLMQTNGVKLKGDYVSVSFNHPENSRIKTTTQKVWVDAIINSQYLK